MDDFQKGIIEGIKLATEGRVRFSTPTKDTPCLSIPVTLSQKKPIPVTLSQKKKSPVKNEDIEVDIWAGLFYPVSPVSYSSPIMQPDSNQYQSSMSLESLTQDVKSSPTFTLPVLSQKFEAEWALEMEHGQVLSNSFPLSQMSQKHEVDSLKSCSTIE